MPLIYYLKLWNNKNLIELNSQKYIPIQNYDTKYIQIFKYILSIDIFAYILTFKSKLSIFFSFSLKELFKLNLFLIRPLKYICSNFQLNYYYFINH